MPTILCIGPYRFYFYSREGNEPPHIHVAAAEKMAKYWLVPVVLAANDRFRSGELTEIETIVRQYRDNFVEAWYAYFRK